MLHAQSPDELLEHVRCSVLPLEVVIGRRRSATAIEPRDRERWNWGKPGAWALEVGRRAYVGCFYFLFEFSFVRGVSFFHVREVGVSKEVEPSKRSNHHDVRSLFNSRED